MATTESLLTAEAYRLLPGPGCPTELVQGQIVMMNMPGFRHGLLCSRIARILSNFVEQHDLGRVVTNDAGIITKRNPDHVRGADVAFYSFARLPSESVPEGYPDIAPELVIEVRSPSDRWAEILTKVAEYLQAGVLAVCVLDSESETLTRYRVDGPTQTFDRDDDLTLPGVLEGFRVKVSEFLVH